jgi:hypothetical protein
MLSDRLGESAMHIHLPKPLHGWREFVGEVGVIVLGVLIAIGFEQIVEQIHWAGEVRSARSALRGEMQQPDRVFAYRVAAQPCIARRLEEINKLVEQAPKHAPVPRVGSLIPDIGNALNDNVWETYRASQTLAHFDDEDLGLLGIYYTQLGNIRRFEGEENRDWGVIKVLEGDPSRLGPEDIAGIRVAIQNARFDNSIIASIAADELDYSRRFGVSPPKANSSRLKEVCAPLRVTA